MCYTIHSSPTSDGYSAARSARFWKRPPLGCSSQRFCCFARDKLPRALSFRTTEIQEKPVLKIAIIDDSTSDLYALCKYLREFLPPAAEIAAYTDAAAFLASFECGSCDIIILDIYGRAHRHRGRPQNT